MWWIVGAILLIVTVSLIFGAGFGCGHALGYDQGRSDMLDEFRA